MIEGSARPGGWWVQAGVAALAAAVIATAPGRAAAGRFLGSLRIPRPDPVAAASPTTPGAADRSVQGLIGGMLSSRPSVARNEPDEPAADPDAAARSAGFVPELPRARTDPATLGVLGARSVDLTIEPAQLHTILTEAGKATVPVPPSLDGVKASIEVARGIRAQYGHCPVADTTLQGQLQGPPPTTPENADCVILTQTPVASAELPPAVPIDELVDIALELSGMSPVQSGEFRRALDGQAILGLTMPRFMRSADGVDVRGVRGVLFTSGARRGPTYTLVWAQNGRVYTLSGYGSAADAVPLAASLGTGAA